MALHDNCLIFLIQLQKNPPFHISYMRTRTMSTICIEVSEKESAAIEAYAIMCGESVSNLICKVVIQEITFMKNRITKDSEIYDYNMLVPVNISNHDENQIIEANYNKIREILGLKKISLGGY